MILVCALELSGDGTEVSLEYLSLIFKLRERRQRGEKMPVCTGREALGITSWRWLFEVVEREWTVESNDVALNICSIA